MQVQIRGVWKQTYYKKTKALKLRQLNVTKILTRIEDQVEYYWAIIILLKDKMVTVCLL